MSMILYNKDECPFCWRVRMALRRVASQTELRAHDDDAWQAQWTALTRFGTVPVLVDGDLVLTDSRTILEYLDESHSGLWPVGPAGRARGREVLAYADGILGPPVRDLVFETRGKAPQERDQSTIDNAVARWRQLMPELATMLGDKAWFAGDCGIADYALITRFALATAYGMPMHDLPSAVADWLARAWAREEVRASAPAVVGARLDETGSGRERT